MAIMVWNDQIILIILLSLLGIFNNVEAYPESNSYSADYNYLEFQNTLQNVKENIQFEGIPVGYYVYDIALDEQDNRAYVTSYWSNTVSVIDTSSNRIIKNITIGTIPGLFDRPSKSIPKDISINPKTNLIYVTSEDSYNISVIDGNTYKVIKNITLDRQGVITDVAVNPNINRIYITGLGVPDVSVIDGNTSKIIANISITDDTFGFHQDINSIAINPINNKVYLTSEANVVRIIDGNTNKLLKNITVGNPENLAINSATGKIYVTSSTNNRIYVIDDYTNKVNETIVTGNNSYSIDTGFFAEIALNPITETIYVTNPTSNTISIIDGKTNSVEKTVKVGNILTSLAVNPITNNVYITNWNSNTISIIDGKTNSVIADAKTVKDKSTPILTAGTNIGTVIPEKIAVNPTTNNVYVTGKYSDNVYVINALTDSLTNSIKIGEVGRTIPVIAVNQDTNFIYVANAENNTVSVIDGYTNTVFKTISVGNHPIDIAVNPNRNVIYVANAENATVSVISGSTNTVFKTISVDNNSTFLGNYPTGIAVNPKTNLVYISYVINDNIDVIDELTFNVIKKFEGFHNPSNIEINSETGKVYLTESLGDLTQIIVINGYTHKVIDQIPIGGSVSDISINVNSGLVYLTNTDQNILSSINPTTNKLTAVLHNNINPSNSGTIECNEQIINNRYVRYDVGSQLKCRANPSTGFEFSSWSGDLSYGLVNDKEINLEVAKFGNLTVNFIEKFQIPIPWELMAGIIISPFIGWLIPFFADRFRERRQQNIAIEYMARIETAYQNNDKVTLHDLKNQIQKIFTEGKISETHYKVLEDKLK